MMNKSKIDWTDFSWNPITGCRHACPYCYAARQSRRFCGDIRINKLSHQLRVDDGLYTLERPFRNSNGQVIPLPVGFEPTFHPYRLGLPGEKNLPANIFAGSMADIFGAWVPTVWIRDVFDACEAALWHNFLFLTKNPARYRVLDQLALLPDRGNYWYGVTITGQGDWDALRPYHRSSMQSHWFLSMEPLHGPVNFTADPEHLPDWVIVGGENGRRIGKIPCRREWVADIVEQCRAHGIPVFMKRGTKTGREKDAAGFMEALMGAEFVREYPVQLTTPAWEHRPVHKVFVDTIRERKACRQCGASVQGKPAVRISGRFYICESSYKGVPE